MKSRFSSRVVILFFVWTALLLLALNGSVSLWDQDEAAYAGFAKRMAEGRNLIIPEFPWSEIHRKPPLHFWLMSLSYKLFGINEFAVRFFSALAVWFSIWLIYRKGRRLTGKTAAFTAAVIMAGNVFVVMLGKMAVTDGLLLFFYTWAGLSLMEYLLLNRKKALISFYTALALGTLVKGPPIILWAGFLWILLWIFFPERQKLTAMRPPLWGIAAILPFVAWLVKAWQINPDFVRWWTDWYVIRRTHSAVIGQTGPPGTYTLLFFLFGLAYLPLVAMVFVYLWKNRKSHDFIFRFLALWFVAGWLPYELLPSKLPAYVLASYPAFALLAGKALAENFYATHRFKFWERLQAVIFILLFLLSAILLVFEKTKIPSSYRIPLGVFAVITAVMAALSLYVLHVKGGDKGKLYAATSLVWVFLIYLILLPVVEPLKNAPKRTAAALGRTDKVREIYVYNTFGHPPSLIFYLEKFNPQARIFLPSDTPSERLGKIPPYGTAYILSPAQWNHIPSSVQQHLHVIRIKGLHTGSVGEQDYLIVYRADE